ncbi:MAG: hypothetical protein FD121_314 [Gallionellaceae bacterium]|nr:MAG: hypothetical protein FD121_314 [Gallionellaceae bacterium]
MQGKQLFRAWTASIALLAMAMASAAQAQDISLNLPAQTYVQNAGSFMLAANETDVLVKKEVTTVATTPKEPYEPPLLSGSNAHLVLGLATIAAAGLTGMTAPEEGCEGVCVGPQPPRDVNGTHAQLAKLTVALAAATITTGLIYHWDDFSLEDGITDPDNLHALLGITGAAMMAVATANSAKVKTGTASHAGLAIAGAAGMVVAIKLTW